jgi:hypothetical protein
VQAARRRGRAGFEDYGDVRRNLQVKSRFLRGGAIVTKSEALPRAVVFEENHDAEFHLCAGRHSRS